MMKESKISTSVFNQWVDNGTAKVLTLERAKQLKGKTIVWSYFGYEMNQQRAFEMVVGDIVSVWDYNKTQPMKGFGSRTEYWQSYMTAKQIEEHQNELVLLDSDGNDSNYIYCHGGSGFFDVPTFTCSDADRCVFFAEKNQNK